MQQKKRTRSRFVKQFRNFLLAIVLVIGILQLPQLSKDVKAEAVNTNNGTQLQEMSIENSELQVGKSALLRQTIQENLPETYIKYTVDETEHIISWNEAVEKKYIIVDPPKYGGSDFSINTNPNIENNPLKSATKIEFVSPKAVNGMGSNGFAGCDNLEEVIIPDTIQIISSGALRNFEKLKRITLPNGISFTGDLTFATDNVDVSLSNVQSLSDFVSMYQRVRRTLRKGSYDTERKNWTLKLKDNEKIPVEKTITAGGMLKLDNENDEYEQETMERLKNLSATYQWYQVKEDGSEVIIPDTAKADVTLKANDFPARGSAYKLIRRITWEVDNDDFTNTSTVDQLVTLKVNPPATEVHKHKTVTKNRKAATCTQKGYTGDIVCSTCGKIIQKGKSIPVAAHKFKKVKAKKASVDAVGNIAYYICENCGRLFTNNTGKKEIKKSQVTVALKVKKGQVLKKKDGTSYQVVDAKKLQVSYVSPSKKKSGTVSIPSKVAIGGKNYQVINIKKNAFKNNRKIKKIVIPSSVVSIENYAFANCKNLKTIEIRTTKLKNKKVSFKAFEKINKKVVIKVSKKQFKNYKKLLNKKGLNGKNKFKAL